MLFVRLSVRTVSSVMFKERIVSVLRRMLSARTSINAGSKARIASRRTSSLLISNATPHAESPACSRGRRFPECFSREKHSIKGISASS